MADSLRRGRDDDRWSGEDVPAERGNSPGMARSKGHPCADSLRSSHGDPVKQSGEPGATTIRAAPAIDRFVRFRPLDRRRNACPQALIEICIGELAHARPVQMVGVSHRVSLFSLHTRRLTAARSIATIGTNRISAWTEPSSRSKARAITACVSSYRILERSRAACWPGSCSRWCLEANAPAPSHSRRLLSPPMRTIRSASAARAASTSPAAAAAVRRLAAVPRNLSQAFSLRASAAPAPASAMLPVKTRNCRAQHHRVPAAAPPHSHSPRAFSPQRPVISSPHHNPAAIIHGGRRGSTVLRDRAARPDLGH